MTTTTPASTRPKLTPETQRRLCKVTEWLMDGMPREETLARTMQEWQLERRQAQKYLRRVQDRLRAEAAEDDLTITLRVVRAKRMRILSETEVVMHNPHASADKVNHALRYITAATRLLADQEKSVQRELADRGRSPKQGVDALPPTAPASRIEQEAEKGQQAGTATKTTASTPPPAPPVQPQPSPLPSSAKKQTSHQQLTRSDRAWLQLLTNESSPLAQLAIVPGASPEVSAPNPLSHQALQNGAATPPSAPSARPT